MPPETNAPASETNAPTTTTPVLPPAIALWAEVSEAATTKGKAVRELVVLELTSNEIEKRKDAVLSLLSKYDDKTKELKKAEKSLVKKEFNGDGSVSREFYVAEDIEKLKKMREDVANISAALSNFFEKNDVKKLYEIAATPTK